MAHFTVSLPIISSGTAVVAFIGVMASGTVRIVVKFVLFAAIFIEVDVFSTVLVLFVAISILVTFVVGVASVDFITTIVVGVNVKWANCRRGWKVAVNYFGPLGVDGVGISTLMKGYSSGYCVQSGLIAFIFLLRKRDQISI